MTTTLPAPPPRSPAPARPAGCPVERRALRTAIRTLADAVTGIAFDAPCCPQRQRAIAGFAGAVLGTVRAVAVQRDDVPLSAAGAAAAEPVPLFARDVSAGSPGLARALTALADLLEQPSDPGAAHLHSPEDLLRCAAAFRRAAGRRRAAFAVPWFLDACSPSERVQTMRAGGPGLRLALRLGEDRWLRRRDEVRGTA
ncbi:MAG TPA: hypothetical protein VHF92_06055 [Geodermatophilus sp.]|nr:hypothetical protein [Geodermatophilus sp.]